MDMHKEVRTVNNNDRGKDWRLIVNSGAQYSENRKETCKTFAELQEL